ncbi:MAG TPA: 30S ribosomal protein S7 [Candidatus Paceibacterota bacterium]|nr:30S ribosomal protein S7 [Candidatus Paceibacterota bacterium]
MRRKVKKTTFVKPDFVYGSLKVEKLINYVMESGKKNTARSVVYGAFENIKEKTKQDPLEVFEEALKNVGPITEVRSKRVGGANYQVPHDVRPERRLALALRWIIEAARSKSGSPMSERLAVELISGAKNEGEAVKKRENVHKMAEANRAFAHFAVARKAN